MPRSPEDRRGRLGRIAAGATAWQTASMVVTQVTFSLVTLVVAARTPPTSFALWGVAAIVLNAQYLVRLGLGQALIAAVGRERLRDAADATFVVTGLLALLTSVAVFAFAPTLATEFGSGFDHADLTLALRVVSVALFFSTLESIPTGLIERELAFRSRALVETGTTVVYGALAAALLAAGAGVWSLIIGRVVLSVLRFGAFYLAAPIRPRVLRRIDVRLTATLLRYGIPLGVAGILGFVTTNVDTALVGRVAGARALGSYALAFAVATLIPTFLANTMLRVFFAVFASAHRAANEPSGAFGLSLYAQLLVLVPVTIGLVVFGGTALTDVFGERWSLAGRLLPILAVYGAAQALGNALTSYLAAHGRPGPQFAGQVVGLAVSLLLAFLLYRYGAVGVTAAFTVGQLAFLAVGCRAAAPLWPEGLLRRFAWLLAVAVLAALAGAISLEAVPAGANGIVALVVFGVVYAGLVAVADQELRGWLGWSFPNGRHRATG